jgi:hypothetical protein
MSRVRSRKKSLIKILKEEEDKGREKAHKTILARMWKIEKAYEAINERCIAINKYKLEHGEPIVIKDDEWNK